MRCHDECARLVKAIDGYITKADDDLTDALEEAGFLDPKGTVSEAATLEERVAAALTAETDYILEAAKDAVDLEEFAKEVWPKLKKGDAVAQDLFEIFMEELQTFMPALVSDYIMQIDADLVVGQVSKRTTAWAQQWSRDLAELMKLDGHEQIETLLKDSLEKGDGVAEFTRAIQESGIRNEYYRARRVSVTETLRAHSYAAQEAILQAPCVESKEWVHTGSYRNEPRANHVKLGGTIIPKGEAFELEGADGVTYFPQFPRATNLPAGESVNCHCIHRAIVNEDVLGLPIEERRRLQAEAIAEMDDTWEKEQTE